MRRALVRVLAAALAFAALPAGAAAPAPAVAAPPALRGLDERFVSGTPVETRDGPRPIEQVREGDWVLAWDEDAGELCWSRVEQTFVTPRQPIWRLTLKLPDGSAESLDCTPGHPFWADGEGWVPACHLQPGQDVATLSGPARVASVAPTGRNRTVYNFEVAGTHCYFVGTGGELVHNAPCSYQTYTKTNGKTGKVYSGRTSGRGTPAQNVANRDRRHDMPGYGPAVLDKSSPRRSPIRGREQLNIERFGGAQSQRGTSGNKINGVSPDNPKAGRYRRDAEREFGL